MSKRWTKVKLFWPVIAYYWIVFQAVAIGLFCLGVWVSHERNTGNWTYAEGVVIGVIVGLLMFGDWLRKFLKVSNDQRIL